MNPTETITIAAASIAVIIAAVIIVWYLKTRKAKKKLEDENPYKIRPDPDYD